MENDMRMDEENAVGEEGNRMMDDTVSTQIVQPTPGFCVKTVTQFDNKTVFVNVCLSEAIPCPKDINYEELLYLINSGKASSFTIPMSIGERRVEHDQSGEPVIVYDVVVNPDILERMEYSGLFTQFFHKAVFEGLQDKYYFELDMQQFTVLNNKKYIGTIQSHRVQIRNVQKPKPKVRPVIEEIQRTLSYKPKPVNPNKRRFIYRISVHPRKGETKYLLAEFAIPPSVELKDIKLELEECKMVFDYTGIRETVKISLPSEVDLDIVEAELNRNADMLFVKLPFTQE